MKFRPFANLDQFIPIHAVLIDYAMPRLSGSAWKILCFIIRKTRGWRKPCDDISYKQIRQGTGIRNDTTVSNALAELMGYVIVKEDGVRVWRETGEPAYIIRTNSGGFQQPNNYRLNFDVELDLPSE